ncbi:Clavaminate synthase-like protein [Nadsonia fulvescens var. elongata DSM 6958]|uniref:Clavaminate synthase-like protein n=1 Tax=Nadsonia fulvescens var. elongata DSM 6958 TaxID=857566 RepID=A0A1E3PUR4_9ASCO|nr:Clavaminate synthase-like protein [Nadsonia fulvescens var. elongata DSM 6958]
MTQELDRKYNVRKFDMAVPSQDQTLDYAQLKAIDLSKFQYGISGLASRKALAQELDEAVVGNGFFFLTNHGIDTETFERMFAISQSVLELPQEEKLKHLAGGVTADTEDRSKSLGGERGCGFKPRSYWSMQNGVRDNIELYNMRDILHDDLRYQHNHPEIVRDYLPVISEYYRKIHNDILKKLCVLCDHVLEVPEGTLWKRYEVYQGDLEKSGGGISRMMVYHGMDPDDDKKTDGTWLRGHSDASSFTFITSQPMATLQIRDFKTGTWKYVPYLKDSLVVNIGDTLEFLTGAYFKSTIHRVVKPPADQIQYKRLALIYFCDFSPVTIIDPEALNSPKLKRLGYTKPKDWGKITSIDWTVSKSRLFGEQKVNDSIGDKPNPVYVHGRLAERWHQLGQPLQV